MNKYLIEHLAKNGVQVVNIDGVIQTTDNTKYQEILSTYDPIDDARLDALMRINQQTSDYVNSQIEDYPDFEKETWELQRQEVAAYNQDINALTPTIDTIAANRGVDRVYLIERINTNTENWRNLSATVAGQRQKLLDQVYTETDYTIIEQINFGV